MGIENGPKLNLEQKASDEEYHKINLDNETIENQIKNENDVEKRHRFYFARKSTTKLPNLLSKDSLEKEKNKVAEDKLNLDKKRLGIEEKSETIEEVNKLKDRIKKFTKDRGINIENRLPDNKDIYFLNNEMFQIVSDNLDFNGFRRNNEIMVNEEKPMDKFETLQHELVHSACIEKFYINNDKEKDNICKGISSGYASQGKNKYLKFFNEGLTETAVQQIYIENDEIAPGMAYRSHVIFVTELAKDLAQKISKKENKEVSQKDILTHLQIGMLQADRSYLKIVIENYGNEAFKALAEMGVKKEDIIKVSRVFKLPTVEEKINSFYDKKETIINMGDMDISYYGED